MKAINSNRFYTRIFIFIMFAQGVAAQDYSPVRENLPPYIFETSKEYDESASMFMRGTMDSVINNGPVRDFYPYNTLFFWG